ncbi:MAG: SpoVG family protein [Sedimentisphaerales bacterium]|nr:SpoVG family protein [Sedimentisphaerales bacterium]
MEISDVRVRLVRKRDDRLKAFCSVTFDHEFVVRDIKIIEGSDGPFVAMPSRRMSDHCDHCGGKNHLKAKFGNECGAALPANREQFDAQQKAKLYVDVAHPIKTKCRHQIQQRVIAGFRREVEKSTRPGYVPVELDEADNDTLEAVD